VIFCKMNSESRDGKRGLCLEWGEARCSPCSSALAARATRGREGGTAAHFSAILSTQAVAIRTPLLGSMIASVRGSCVSDVFDQTIEIFK
jgi:hypothetical protein